MKYRWLVVAIMLFLLTVFLEIPNLFTLCLCLFWIGRLIQFKNLKLFALSFLLAGGLIFRYSLIQDETTIPSDVTTSYAISKLTTVRTDGDQLRFEAYLPDYQESVMVQYTFESLEEKEAFNIENLDTIILSGELIEPENSRNINQFDYKIFLNRQNIYYLFRAKKIKPTGELSTKVPLGMRLDKVRFRLLSRLENLFYGQALDYIQALVFGHFQALDMQTVDLFRGLGIVHLMSISGLHIDLLIQLLSRLFALFNISKERRSITFIIVLPIFMVLAGAGTSVFRAVVSNMLRFIFLLTGIRLSRSDCWSITCILALLVNPLVIYSVGFQLSYGISGLLILISETKLLRRYKTVSQVLILNLLVNLFSLPIITYHYFEFPLMSYILNLLFVPVFSSLIFPLIIICLCAGFLLPGTIVLEWINQFTNLSIRMMEGLLEGLMATAEWSLVPGRLSWPMYVLVALSFYLILVWLESKKRKKIPILAFSILYSLAIFSNQVSVFGRIYVFDVGQGESILIKPPFSASGTMIDTGGRYIWTAKEDWQVRERPYSLAENEVIPILKSLGIRNIDSLYLSHGDYDHIGELQNLYDNFKVNTILLSQSTLDSELFQTFDLKDATIEIVSAGQILNQNKVNLAALYPENKSGISLEDGNDSSLVLYGYFGELAWLFTGDLEGGGESFLVTTYPQLPVDVLKVAHHGSRTSSSEEFIYYYQPSYGLISAGMDNQYGHPHSEVINRLTAVDTQIYRTDIDGGILYTYSEIKVLNQFIQAFVGNN